MKKFLVVFLLGLLIAGSAFAQWSNTGYAQPAQPQQPQQTISGTLQIIYGTIAIVSTNNQVYYVPSLQPWYGANGLFLNAYVTVYGTIGNNNHFYPTSFMAGGKWYILPGCNTNVASAHPKYEPPVVVVVVPMYPQQGCYPHNFGW